LVTEKARTASLLLTKLAEERGLGLILEPGCGGKPADTKNTEKKTA